MTNGGYRLPHLADRSDIELWANKIEARSEFPRLIRMLINQTNDQVAMLEMRAAEGIDLPGYDGRVRAAKETPFVPGGFSVWELGVGENPKVKAQKDYKTRTADPKDVDPSDTTFVFITPHEFRDKQAWVAEKKEERIWSDVKVLDVDDIDQAFESAPAAHLWFSEAIGKPAGSIQTIEDWWNRFASQSSPALVPELALCGRADEAAELMRILDLSPRITMIAAASVDDVLAFVAATLLSSPEETRLDVVARALIVKDAISLRQLEAASGLLLLLPWDDELRREALLVRSHHVVILAPEGTPAQITLPPIERGQFGALLERLGVPKDSLGALSRAANRSLLAFQRQSPATGVSVRPHWSEQLASTLVRRAWLAGEWTERRSGDLDALSALLGTPYENARDKLMETASGPDPLFLFSGDTWSVVSPLDGWDHGHRFLSLSDVSALEEIVQSVLGAVDPALELPMEDRWQAGIFGKTRVHSPELRRGLSTTLALVGTFGESINLGRGLTARGATEAIVFRLLDRANRDASGQLWASLGDELLPLVAEAAPDVFMRAVDEGLVGEEPLLTTMFMDTQADALSVSSPHTGLLWALETLAWSPEHLGLAVELLARLAEIDPGGRLSNRPQNSLVDIFRSWMPQTAATPKQRLSVLDALRSTHGPVAWKLLLGLLPHQNDVGRYTHSPRFRDWKARTDSDESDSQNGN